MVSKNNPLRDGRHLNKYCPYVDFFKRPTSEDIRHPKTGQIYSRPYYWRVSLKPDGLPPVTGVEGELWYLQDITANVANWKQLVFTSGGVPLLTFTTDVAGPVAPTGAGVVDTTGTSVFSDGTAANTLTLNVQATAETFLLGAGAGSSATELGPLTDGQLIIGSTGGAPVLSALASADASVIITPGAGSIDLSVAPGSGFTWNGVAGMAQAMVAHNGYIFENAGASTSTLPESCTLGDTFWVVAKGAGLVKIAQNANQTIQFGNRVTTSGVTGSLVATAIGDAINLLCTADDEFFVLASVGVWAVE